MSEYATPRQCANLPIRLPSLYYSKPYFYYCFCLCCKLNSSSTFFLYFCIFFFLSYSIRVFLDKIIIIKYREYSYVYFFIYLRETTAKIEGHVFMSSREISQSRKTPYGMYNYYQVCVHIEVVLRVLRRYLLYSFACYKIIVYIFLFYPLLFFVMIRNGT